MGLVIVIRTFSRFEVLIQVESNVNVIPAPYKKNPIRSSKRKKLESNPKILLYPTDKTVHKLHQTPRHLNQRTPTS